MQLSLIGSKFPLWGFSLEISGVQLIYAWNLHFDKLGEINHKFNLDPGPTNLGTQLLINLVRISSRPIVGIGSTKGFGVNKLII